MEQQDINDPTSNLHDGTECVSVDDSISSSNSISLLSPVSIMSFDSEPTSLDVSVIMPEDTHNALTDLSVLLGSEDPVHSASH